MKPVPMLIAGGLAVTTAVAAPIAVGATRPAAHAAKTSVAVTAKEFKFTLRPTTAKNGSVTFRVQNAGKVGHNFKIAGKTTPMIKPNKSATLTLSLKKGSYPYLCTVPGHSASGMKGTFKVT